MGSLVLSLSLLAVSSATSDDDMWIGWRPLPPAPSATLRSQIKYVSCGNQTAQRSPLAHACDELASGLSIMLATRVAVGGSGPGGLRVQADVDSGVFKVDSEAADEAWSLVASGGGGAHGWVLSSKSGRGALHGAFRLLNMLQLGTITDMAAVGLPLAEQPLVGVRKVDMWDNVNGTVEYLKNMGGAAAGRGMAVPVVHFNELPTLRPRYAQLARLLASMGVNAVTLNNINACTNSNTPLVTEEWLARLGPLAALLAEYGLATYLCPCFDAPTQIGRLPTSDPLNSDVVAWWAHVATLTAAHLGPGFGGYVVKAGCENEPGPAKYNRSSAEGANMFAAALRPHGGLVQWRSFVHPPHWSQGAPVVDQARYVYDAFIPLDGQWAENVVLQTKAGPFDFQVVSSAIVCSAIVSSAIVSSAFDFQVAPRTHASSPPRLLSRCSSRSRTHASPLPHPFLAPAVPPTPRPSRASHSPSLPCLPLPVPPVPPTPRPSRASHSSARARAAWTGARARPIDIWRAQAHAAQHGG